jgi:polysaccharide chain length determinant protein (PEP-CTERM system associated)
MLPGKRYQPQDFLAIAWRRKWLILVSVVTCTFAGLVVSARLPNLFRSEMLIQIVPQRVPTEFVRTTVTLRTEDRIQAIFQQAKSRTRLEQIINDLNLYPEERARLPIQDVVERMQDQVSVEVIRGDRNESAEAFKVKFQYPDAELSARVTGILGASFVSQNSKDREELSKATNEFLQRQLEDARAQLEEQEKKLERFREQHAGELPTQLTFNTQAIQNTQMQLQALNESLARDRDRKLMLERLLVDAENLPTVAPPAPPVGPQGDAAAGTPEQQLEVARAALTKLRTRFTPEHPDIVRAERQVAELEEKVKATSGGAKPQTATGEELARQQRLQQMRAEVESLERQVEFKQASAQHLQNTIADYQRRIEAVPSTESEWVRLTRDYDTITASYKDLLAKSESSRVAANLEDQQIGEQFRVLDPARVPIRPVSPVRSRITASAFAIGLFFGLGLTALLEFLDATYKTEADVIEVLKMPVLALVPYLPTDADRRTAQRKRWFVSVAATLAIVAGSFVFWSMRLWKFVV